MLVDDLAEHPVRPRRGEVPDPVVLNGQLLDDLIEPRAVLQRQLNLDRDPLTARQVQDRVGKMPTPEMPADFGEPTGSRPFAFPLFPVQAL